MTGHTIELDVHLSRRGGRVRLAPGRGPSPKPDAPGGRVPRVARLVALALKIDRMLASGEVESLAEVARLGQISTARASQIADLALLAPDIVEEVLFMGRVQAGRDRVTERDLRLLARQCDWVRQRAAWRVLLTKHTQSPRTSVREAETLINSSC